MPPPGPNPSPSDTQPRDAQLGPWSLFAVGILMILAASAFDHQGNQDDYSWPARGSPCGW
jgi:hypothetical protein